MTLYQGDPVKIVHLGVIAVIVKPPFQLEDVWWPFKRLPPGDHQPEGGLLNIEFGNRDGYHVQMLPQGQVWVGSNEPFELFVAQANMLLGILRQVDPEGRKGYMAGMEYGLPLRSMFADIVCGTTGVGLMANAESVLWEGVNPLGIGVDEKGGGQPEYK